MARELFKEEQSLNEIHRELINHLLENSDVRIDGKGKITFYVPENGECSFWFNDLVEIILHKLAAGDDEIIKMCFEKNIDLLDIKIKPLKKHEN